MLCPVLVSTRRDDLVFFSAPGSSSGDVSVSHGSDVSVSHDGSIFGGDGKIELPCCSPYWARNLVRFVCCLVWLSVFYLCLFDPKRISVFVSFPS